MNGKNNNGESWDFTDIHSIKKEWKIYYDVGKMKDGKIHYRVESSSVMLQKSKRWKLSICHQ